MIPNMAVDHHFMKTYELSMASGRWFDEAFTTDATAAFIINESAAKGFGWTPDDAVGKTLLREYDRKAGHVVGVVKDFHFDMLTSPVTALVLDINPGQVAVLNVRLGGTEVKDYLRTLSVEWNNVFPEKTFQYDFVDEQLAREYRAYEQFGNTIRLAAVLALAICAMGVYGLMLFTVQRKVKEIAIRKILGASVGAIMQTFFLRLVILVAVAVLVASPVAYWIIDGWLAQFAYRVPIGVGSFALSAFLVVGLIILTVDVQVWRAATANPVQSLRA